MTDSAPSFSGVHFAFQGSRPSFYVALYSFLYVTQVLLLLCNAMIAFQYDMNLHDNVRLSYAPPPQHSLAAADGKKWDRPWGPAKWRTALKPVP